jgi:rhodanese-related sulfurtransferase
VSLRLILQRVYQHESEQAESLPKGTNMKALAHYFGMTQYMVALAATCALAPTPGALAQSRPTIHQVTFEQPNQATPEISTEELKRLLAAAKPIVLLDVRPQSQYALAHIPGAVNIPVSINLSQKELPAAEEEIIAKAYPDKTTFLVLYCNGEYWLKSNGVSEKLHAAGYINVKRYQLGLPVWRALGNTVQTDLDGFRYVYTRDKTAVFVDARTAEEFKAETVPGAVNVRRGFNYDQGTRVIVFGSSPAQAREVAEQIARTAYWNSSYFGGSFDDLKRAGLW